MEIDFFKVQKKVITDPPRRISKDQKEGLVSPHLSPLQNQWGLENLFCSERCVKSRVSRGLGCEHFMVSAFYKGDRYTRNFAKNKSNGRNCRTVILTTVN